MTYRIRNVAIAIGLALVAMLLTLFYVVNYRRSVQHAQATVQVYVAKRNINPGTAGSDIAHGNGLVKLSWSTHLVGFSLEWRESLATGIWSPVPGTPTVEGNKFIVTLSDTGAGKYFHLRGP